MLDGFPGGRPSAPGISLFCVPPRTPRPPRATSRTRAPGGLPDRGLRYFDRETSVPVYDAQILFGFERLVVTGVRRRTWLLQHAEGRSVFVPEWYGLDDQSARLTHSLLLRSGGGASRWWRFRGRFGGWARRQEAERRAAGANRGDRLGYAAAERGRTTKPSAAPLRRARRPSPRTA